MSCKNVNLSFRRGGTASWQINMGVPLTGGAWEIIETNCPSNPALTMLDAGVGTAKLSFLPATTLDWKPATYNLRIRCVVSADVSYAFPPFRIKVL